VDAGVAPDSYVCPRPHSYAPPGLRTSLDRGPTSGDVGYVLTPLRGWSKKCRVVSLAGEGEGEG